MVAVISVDAYCFFGCLTLRIQEYVFCSCTVVPPDSKETKLESSNQEASPSAGKSTGVVLLPCCAGKCVPRPISSVVNISEVPGCHLL